MDDEAAIMGIAAISTVAGLILFELFGWYALVLLLLFFGISYFRGRRSSG